MKKLFASLLFLSTLNPQLSTVLAQGPLTPPGLPAPTMKTLDQVEPRIAINATNTPGGGGGIHNIASPGSYYLTGNLAVFSGIGILVTAPDVTIDLNGFRIFNSSSGSEGIRIDTGANRCVVKNGFISGFSFHGTTVTGATPAVGGSFLQVVVSDCSFSGLRAGAGWRIDGCQAFGNGTDGIVAGDGSTLTNCTALENGGNGIISGNGSTLTNCSAKDNGGSYGIFAGEGSTLTNCTAFSNDVEHGIHADMRSTVTNCTASGNDSAGADSWGISVGIQSTISGCTASANTNTNGTPNGSTGGGIQAGSSCTVQNCTVVGNKGDGIQLNGDGRVVGNNCDSNGFGGDAAGIHSTGADNRIEANNVTDNTRGIDVDAAGSLIIKNSASGNGSNYEIAASNAVGVIVSAPASVAISGSTGGAGIGSTDPWANLSF